MVSFGGLRSWRSSSRAISKSPSSRKLDDETIDAAGERAARVAKPADNADFGLAWRKKMVPAFVGYALRELPATT